MTPQNADTGEFAVLFVDDEGASCEVLRDAMAGRLPVITANGVEQALTILERQGDEIGVLLTDQRMPGRSGVDLLRVVRERWPAIVRLLTTAYTDYDDAIAAVNRGEILRYIHKPWDIHSLRLELQHAMELFSLRREREQLIEEKLSVRRHLAEAGRARDLLVLCGALGLRNTVAAVAGFLAQGRAGDDEYDPALFEHPDLMCREAQRSIAIARELRTLLGDAIDDGSTTPLAASVAAAASKIGVAIDGLDALPEVDLPSAPARRLLELLLEEAAAATPDHTRLSLAATADATEVVLNIGHGGHGSTPHSVRRLAAFLLCGHLGGGLTLNDGGTTHTLSLRLPLQPTAGAMNEASCIERIFAGFDPNEGW